MMLTSQNSEYQNLLNVLNNIEEKAFLLFTISDKIEVLHASDDLLAFSGYQREEILKQAQNLFNPLFYNNNKNNLWDIKQLIKSKKIANQAGQATVLCQDESYKTVTYQLKFLTTINEKTIFMLKVTPINENQQLVHVNQQNIVKLEIINQCAQSLIAGFDIEKSMRIALQACLNYYQASLATIYLDDENQKQFVNYFQVGSIPSKIAIPYELITTCSLSLKNQTTLFIQNWQQLSPNCLEMLPELFKDMQNMLLIPYIVQDKIKGLMILNDLKANYEDDLLISVASLIFNELTKHELIIEYKKQEEARNDLLTNSQIGVISFIKQNQVIDFRNISDGIVNLLQDSRENIIKNLKSDFYYYVYKPDLEYVKKNTLNVYKNKVASGSITYRIVVLEQLIWVSVKTTLIKKHGADIVFMTVNSVQEIKDLEKELSLAKQSLEVAINGSNMAYWEYDLINNWMISSHYFVENYDFPEIIKENVPYYINDDENVLLEDRPKIIKALLQLRNTPVKSIFYDYHLLDKNGRYHLKRDILTKLYDENNVAVKAVGISMNLEEISKLRNENNLLSNLLDLLKALGTDEFTDKNDFFKALLNALVKTIKQAEYGSILINDGSDNFRFVALYNYKEGPFKDIVLDIKETNVYVYSQGKCDEAIIFHDLLKYDEDFIKTNKMQKFVENNQVRINTTLSCPITKDGNLVAIINLDSTLVNAFDENDKKTIELFGLEVANFIKLNELIDMQKYEINHDKLTGVNSRLYFDNTLKKYDQAMYLPLSIISVDANGLKLINDTFGHTYGDSLLRVISKNISQGLRNDDVVARVGGDEFIVLMLKANEVTAQKRMQEIAQKMSKVKIKGITITLSYGIATKVDMKQNIKKVIADSDAKMYQNKAMYKKIHQNAQIEDIINYVFKKYPYEKKRTEVVKQYVEIIGEKLSLKESEIEDLKIIAHYHNIGKAGINYDDDLEDTQIKHCEKGNLILCSSSTFVRYANVVLLHHEHYDGSGPLRNLIGEQIPLFARIMAVADEIAHVIINKQGQENFDKAAIINRLVANSGSKIDPNLASLMVKYFQKL